MEQGEVLVWQNKNLPWRCAGSLEFGTHHVGRIVLGAATERAWFRASPARRMSSSRRKAGFLGGVNEWQIRWRDAGVSKSRRRRSQRRRWSGGHQHWGGVVRCTFVDSRF